MKSLLVLLSSLLAATAFADGLPTTPYIYVQGAAEERVDPDLLTINFNLTATDADQTKAKAAVTTKSEAVFKLLSQLGITDDAIVAPALSVQENYEFSSAKRTLNGYTVTRGFTVRVKDLSLYPKIVNSLVELRVESLDNVQPGFTQAAAHSVELKKAAMAQARQQADDLAQSMGAKVTGVFAVSPIAFGEIPHAIFGGSGGGPIFAGQALAMRADKASGDKYVFDKLTLSERLHVIFLIEPGAK